MNIQISKQANDIIQKYTSGLFKDAMLDFYGIHTAPVKELINPELPVVEVKGSSTDYIFLLEDDSCMHLEFQTKYSESDIIRFAIYDLRLFERDQRKIHTVIIYTADVSHKPASLHIGSLEYDPARIMIIGYDGDEIYAELEKKIESGEELTDKDILNLVFLPLMRSKFSRYELAKKVITLAKSIKDKRKRDACIASAFAFASKYLNEKEMDQLWEVLKMNAVMTRLITQEVEKELASAVEKELAKAVEKELAKAVEKNAVEIAKNALKEGAEIQFIRKITGLDESTIKQLQAEIESQS